MLRTFTPNGQERDAAHWFAVVDPGRWADGARLGPDTNVDVVLVRWPEESGRLERLRASGAPRLLLVGEDLGRPAWSTRSRTGSASRRPSTTSGRG